MTLFFWCNSRFVMLIPDLESRSFSRYFLSAKRALQLYLCAMVQWLIFFVQPLQTNQWLYFLSFEPGYYPYNLDQDEVVRMTNYFLNLELALQCYESEQVHVDFEHGEMYYFEFGKDKKTWKFEARPLPFTSFQFGNLLITDDELLEDLKDAPKCKAVLEADIAILGISVSDKKFKRPANPATCMIADAASRMMLSCKLQEPGEDAIVALAEEMIGFIFQYGAPKEVRVSNILVEAGLEQICQTCGIKLRR